MNVYLRDRRACFFMFFSLLSFLLVIPCPLRFHFVGYLLGAMYLVLSVLSLLDSRARLRAGQRS